MLAPIFGFAIPVVCYFLDPMDRRRDYTLGYFCWCRNVRLNHTVTSSLIIITLNRALLLKRTLEGLARQLRQIDEIIVVDNGPTADTEQVVSSFTARYVPEPHRGYAHARNRGLAEASGDVIYFLDDDCVPEPDWSDVLWNVLDSGDADLASGSRAPGQPGLAARLEYLSTDGPVLSPAWLPGPRAICPLRISFCGAMWWSKVGCFDTTLTMCEDRDFTTRARKAWISVCAMSPRPASRTIRRFIGVSDYLGKMRHYGTGTSQYFRRWREEEPLAARVSRQSHRALAAAARPGRGWHGVSSGAQSAAKSRRASAEPAAFRRTGLLALGRV